MMHFGPEQSMLAADTRPQSTGYSPLKLTSVLNFLFLLLHGSIQIHVKNKHPKTNRKPPRNPWRLFYGSLGISCQAKG